MKTLYTANALKGFFKAGDSQKYAVDLSIEGASIANDAAERIASSNLDFSFKGFRKSGRDIIRLDSLATTLAVRAASQSISKHYGICVNDRNVIVASIMESLLDSTPYRVEHVDIKSFFEAVPAGKICREICKSLEIDPNTRSVISGMLNAGIYGDTFAGAVRGVSLSSILAEYSLLKFDAEARKTLGTYRYFRYVDDILIIKKEVDSSGRLNLEKILPPEFEFNDKGRPTPVRTLPAANNCESPCIKSFEYLGYQFSISENVRHRRNRVLDIGISSSKVSRVKRKIVHSLKAFEKNGDADLLADRLEYLAHTRRVKRRGHTHGNAGERVLVGLPRTYHLCTKVTDGKRGPIYAEREMKELQKIDDFLSYLQFSKGSPYSPLIRRIASREKRKRLRMVSFVGAFTSKSPKRYTRERAAQIARAWSNV